MFLITDLKTPTTQLIITKKLVPKSETIQQKDIAC